MNKISLFLGVVLLAASGYGGEPCDEITRRQAFRRDIEKHPENLEKYLKSPDAKMLLNSPKSAEDLISSVATKGGCTRVGVDYMDEADTSDIFYNLIDKTAKKANALGK